MKTQKITLWLFLLYAIALCVFTYLYTSPDLKSISQPRGFMPELSRVVSFLFYVALSKFILFLTLQIATGFNLFTYIFYPILSLIVSYLIAIVISFVLPDVESQTAYYLFVISCLTGDYLVLLWSGYFGESEEL